MFVRCCICGRFMAHTTDKDLANCGLYHTPESTQALEPNDPEPAHRSCLREHKLLDCSVAVTAMEDADV